MAQRLSPLTRSDALKRLAVQAAHGHLPPSLLLEGPEGSGKELAALELAVLALCAHAADEAGAASPDQPCARKVRRLAHPDLRYAFPVEASITPSALRELLDEKANEPLARIRQPSSAVLPIGDADDPSPCSVREIRRFVAMKPFEGRRRVVIVADAHRMNRQAANALLKTLEEPPEAALLMLCTHQPGLLPATVRSRCARVRVPPLTDDELAGHLEAAHGLQPEEAYRLVAAAGQNARKALDLIDPQARTLASWADSLLVMLVEGRLPELLRGAELLAKGQDPSGREASAKFTDAGLSVSRDVAMRTLDFLTSELVALARLLAGASLATVRAARLRPLLKALGPRDPATMADILMRARDDLGRNVNVSLVLTTALADAARARGGRGASSAAEGGDAQFEWSAGGSAGDQDSWQR